MITVKFRGGPKDGQEQELNSPAEFIFPAGRPLDAVLGIMEGLKGGWVECYVLDDKRSTYRWAAIRTGEEEAE